MRLLNRIPPVWLVVWGIISVQVGAAIAKDLFHLVPPTALVWLRLFTSAVILLIMAVGVFLSGVRDLYAALGLPGGNWPWPKERDDTR